MNVHKLRMDTSGNVEDISFVLAKKNGDKLGNITNIDNIVNISFSNNSITFKNNEVCYIGPKYKNSLLEVIRYDSVS